MLTRRGASVLLAIALFSFVGWASANPIFATAALTLVLVVLIESTQLKVVLHVVKKLKITRNIADSRLDVGGRTQVLLQLSNPTLHSAGYVSIEDQIPQGLVATTDAPAPVEIKSNQEVSLSYSIAAAQIGEYEIRGLSASAIDPLGLATFTVSLPLRSRLEVYPRPKLMHILRVRRVNERLIQNSIGQTATSALGHGMDFRGIREYYAGDDFKHIAWKAVAKSPRHQIMTREFDAGRNLNLVLCLHAKKSMFDGPLGHRKLDYAVEAIVTITYAASFGGDNLVFNFGTHSEKLATLGQGRQRQLVRALRSTYNLSPMKSEALDVALRSLARELHRRSLVIVITDSEQDSVGDFYALTQLLPGHTVHVIAMKTTSLFAEPNLADPNISMGYDLVTSREERTLGQIRENCYRVGFSLRVCDASEITRVLFDIYLAAKKSGVISA